MLVQRFSAHFTRQSVRLLCASCFTTACSTKIDEYVATITPETATNTIAKDFKTTNLLEGIDYYLENGNYVFKAWFHLKEVTLLYQWMSTLSYGFKKHKILYLITGGERSGKAVMPKI
jgi:hypothetical protein